MRNFATTVRSIPRYLDAHCDSWTSARSVSTSPAQPSHTGWGAALARSVRRSQHDRPHSPGQACLRGRFRLPPNPTSTRMQPPAPGLPSSRSSLARPLRHGSTPDTEQVRAPKEHAACRRYSVRVAGRDPLAHQYLNSRQQKFGRHVNIPRASTSQRPSYAPILRIT